MLHQIASLEISDEFCDIIAGQVIEVTFVQESVFFFWVEDAKRRQVLSLDFCRLAKLLLCLPRHSRLHEDDLSVEVFRCLLEDVLIPGALVLREEYNDWLLVAEDCADMIFTEGDQTGDRSFLGESDDLFLSGSTAVAQWGLVESAG